MKKLAVLTIAGSDPSGGAGLQGDLKTFERHGVFGMGALTLLTVQDTRGVQSVKFLDPEFVRAQIATVIQDIPPQAVKTGALGSAEVIDVIAELAKGFAFPLVIDPVIASTNGVVFMDDDAKRMLVKKLMPHAAVIMPNMPEAELLSGRSVKSHDDFPEAARAIADLGAKAVLIKGGHLEGEYSRDLLFWQGRELWFSSEYFDTRHTHGTGCTYSAAVTVELAKGQELAKAVENAKAYVTRAIRTGLDLGQGHGPLNHGAIDRNSQEEAQRIR
ncbi:MAG: bifunctional hydroxymethylpyrimidine kinase/phosphomethylpyrimidine kinase [Candidatus Omnitrophota bacterium]|nr:bifunctional hydroxymethylpyrimidine kinase/phosphomethylpyrimidine kinase [Candidatus Omnitrophota bacterium]